MWKTTRACTPPDKFRCFSTTSYSSPSLTTSPSCPYLCRKELVLPSEEESEETFEQHSEKWGKEGGEVQNSNNNWEEEEEEEEEELLEWQKKQELLKLNRNVTVNRYVEEEEEDAMATLATINEANTEPNSNHVNRKNNAINNKSTSSSDTFELFTAPNAKEHDRENNDELNERRKEYTSLFTLNLSKENTSFKPCSTSDAITSGKCLPLCNKLSNPSCNEQECKCHSRQLNYYLPEQSQGNFTIEKEEQPKENREYQVQEKQREGRYVENSWSNIDAFGAEAQADKNVVPLNIEWTHTTKSPSYEYVLNREPQYASENVNNQNDDDDTIAVYETPYLQRTETHCFVEQNVDVLPTLVPSLMYTPQVDPERLTLRAALDHELDVINEAHKYTMLDPITTLIEDELYIGGFPDESTIVELRNKEIKNVINCCSCDYVSDAEFKKEFNVIELACYDQDDYLILHTDYDLFRQILEELTEQRHQRVFVHCIAGVNRSVTLCAAYLIDRLHISPIDAVRLFRSNGRMHILDNKYFRHQLIDHYLQSVENANIRITTRLSL